MTDNRTTERVDHPPRVREAIDELMREKDATDNRTTELLDGLRSVGNLHEFAELFGFNWEDDSDWAWHDVAVKMADELEQAIAATLGRPKAKAHPYGYEPDMGAFDCTRCKCGCINDISATYCNDCGGEIEIDMYAEKEIYHTPRHLVFAEKHDDGSLEFGGKRYVAATLDGGECAECAEGMGRYADSLCDPLKQRIAELEEQRDELLRCLENDWNIRASWDGLRKFWSIELTEKGVRLRDAELNSRSERTCESVAEYAKSPIDGKTIVLHRCSSCHELMRPHMNYCPNCGCKVVGE